MQILPCLALLLLGLLFIGDLAPCQGIPPAPRPSQTELGMGMAFDPVQFAGIVMVGEALEGTAADDGTRVHIQAKLRVVRVLKGDTVAPGDVVPIAWTYEPRPNQPPQVTQTLPEMFGIWALRERDGAMAPYSMQLLPGIGDSYFPLPRGTHPIGDATTTKGLVAGEIASALEFWAAEKPHVLDNFAKHSQAPIEEADLLMEGARLNLRTNYLCQNSRDYVPVFERLAASPSRHLRSIGYAGLIANRRDETILSVERELPVLRDSLGWEPLVEALGSFAPIQNPECILALGRIAVSEEADSELEYRAAHALAFTFRAESAPYLAALLNSPDWIVRRTAVMGLCNLTLGDLAHTIFRDHRPSNGQQMCPEAKSEIAPEIRKRIVEQWRDWWDKTHDGLREQLAKPEGGRIVLADVRTPARWNADRGESATQTVTRNQMIRMLIDLANMELPAFVVVKSPGRSTEILSSFLSREIPGDYALDTVKKYRHT